MTSRVVWGGEVIAGWFSSASSASCVEVSGGWWLGCMTKWMRAVGAAVRCCRLYRSVFLTEEEVMGRGRRK